MSGARTAESAAAGGAVPAAGSEIGTAADPAGGAAAWLRALERTAGLARNPQRILPVLIEEMRARSAPALLSSGETLSYEALAALSCQYARWALDQGVGKGEVVALLMTNRPEYFAIWLGVTSVGGVVALLNTNLGGQALAHSIRVAGARRLIVENAVAGSLATALPHLEAPPTIWMHGDGDGGESLPRIDLEARRRPAKPLDGGERRQVSIRDPALLIFTSGTTGLPKAAHVSHARIMQWSEWFAGMMDVQPEDRMYSCLPMYHSVGGVLAPGAMLAGGGSIVVREKFSSSQFWDDVRRWDCTLIQYIGELCRYLLHDAPPGSKIDHRIRMACGNGLAPEIWEEFKERFRIPRIFEFYAATEGGVSLFNIEGRLGAIGRIPGYLAHRFAPALIEIDGDSGQPVRDANGFCLRSAPNQPGEAIGKITEDRSDSPDSSDSAYSSSLGSRFEGYTDPEASASRILHDVFEPGDAWVRTGDLMRKDARGFFYFVDRLGDTFRWKGENVASLEVANAIGAFPGVKHANVYGVAIPAAEGRIGMAAIVAEAGLDLAGLQRHLAGRLPAYARPAFLRICGEVETTGTFKYSKAELARQGYDPAATPDAIYFNDSQAEAFVPLDRKLYLRIQAGGSFGCDDRRHSGDVEAWMKIGEFRGEFERVGEEIARGPIVPNVTAEEIRSHLALRYDFSRPLILEDVVADVERMLKSWQVQVTHPRYFGLFNPSVTLASAVADALVAMYNSQLANWRTSPVGNEVERHTLRWLAAKFGFPEESLATFTTGGTEANLSAVVVALTRRFPEYGEEGLRRLSAPPAIYLTREAHHGFNKIAHMTGLGRRSLRVVATDDDLKLDLGDLERCVAEDRREGWAPFMVVGSCGTTAAGVIDPLPEIAEFCRREGLWFHADAAWGGAAILSPSLRPYLAGIDSADSITCDAHKWFSVPMGCGMFFCRYPEAVHEAFRADVSYMPKKTEEQGPDPYTTSVQWSRRLIGLKLFMSLAQHGESGQTEMIEHQTRMGQVLRRELEAAGWSIVNKTPLPLVCFTRDGLVPGAFLAALRERQIAWMSEATLRGHSVLRACVTSFRTTAADIHWVVKEMSGILGRGAAQPAPEGRSAATVKSAGA